MTYVSFWDAARYVNWLSTGSTEKGVYTMMPKQDDNKNEPIQRNQDAFDEGAFALPSHAEWVSRLVCIRLRPIQRCIPSQPRVIPSELNRPILKVLPSQASRRRQLRPSQPPWHL